MSVYRKAGSPYWWFDFVFKGVRYYGSTGIAGSKEDAKAVEGAERTRAARAQAFGAPKARDKITIKAAFGRYFEEVSRHTAAADADLAKMAKLMALGIGADRQMCEIEDGDLTQYVSRRRGQRARHKESLVAPATVNREVELFRRIWRRAKESWGVEVGKEPMWRRHMLAEPCERVRALTAEEEAKLLAALRDDFRPVVRFALMAGMRLGNVIRLRWSEVDFQAMAMTFKVESRRPGGDARALPITPAMRALLAEQRGHHPIYVFTYLCRKDRARRKAGQRYPYSATGWRRHWSRALERAGVEDFRFHDIRHTAATRTLKACSNLKVVQKMLGHASITTTARYAHVLDDDIREAMEKAQSPNSPTEAVSEARKTGGKPG